MTTLDRPSRGKDIEIQGGKTDATARAFWIVQWGEGPQDVVIFGRDGYDHDLRPVRR